MIKLFKHPKNLFINRTTYQTTHQLNAALSTVTIKLDGKPINIGDLPKKPKSLNLFQNYCAELGVSGQELRNQREKLMESFKENKPSYLAKNQKVIESYKNDLKAYREVYKKQVKLRDVSGLIEFCNKMIAKKAAKEAARKQRKLSFYNFFVKKASEEGVSKDLKVLAHKFKNMSSSELDSYKRQYEDYLRTLSN